LQPLSTGNIEEEEDTGLPALTAALPLLARPFFYACALSFPLRCRWRHDLGTEASERSQLLAQRSAPFPVFSRIEGHDGLDRAFSTAAETGPHRAVIQRHLSRPGRRNGLLLADEPTRLCLAARCHQRSRLSSVSSLCGSSNREKVPITMAQSWY
jgi:hypothetical protein